MTSIEESTIKVSSEPKLDISTILNKVRIRYSILQKMNLNKRELTKYKSDI
jgi:hypothetical protein